MSSSFPLENGVPQGSVLSGTLFTLAINDINSDLPVGVKNNLYMDDFAIYYSASRIKHAERVINKSITKIDEWASSVGFKFSINKTQSIIFYKNTKHQYLLF